MLFRYSRNVLIVEILDFFKVVFKCNEREEL